MLQQKIENLYSTFIAKRTYTRWIEDEKRRETWDESVDRYGEYFVDRVPESMGQAYSDAMSFKKEKQVMGSMRALWSAGPALENNDFAAFNCAFVTFDEKEKFGEMLYILMHGSGMGFSVERQFINKLPDVPMEFVPDIEVFVVPDSKLGWKQGFDHCIFSLYNGIIPKFDFTEIRPKGARLKTFGGRSSGPEPLRQLFAYAIKIFTLAKGRKLNSLECHDIATMTANCVVVGGVRRCLPSSANVFVKGGAVPISQVSVGDEVLTSNGYHRVTNKFYQGKQELVRVYTQDSRFDCTPNHKVAVLNGVDTYNWKMVSELVAGDRLIAPSFGVVGSTQNLPLSTTCKDIVIPELDNDMCWLLGLIQGDGYIRITSKSGEVCVPINKEQTSIGDKAKSILEKFGVHVWRTDYTKYYVLKVKSKQLASYFHSWLKQPNMKLVIPEFIWNCDIEKRLSFVGGLMDANGKTKPIQVCESVYEDYVKSIRMLLATCGVQSRFNVLTTKRMKEGWQPKFSVSLINDTSKKIMNDYTTKQNVSSQKAQRLTNSYPKKLLPFNYPNNCSWDTVGGKLIPVKFVKIESVGVDETWDIEVETAHEFFCEGYLMHNSACISFSNLSDQRMKHAKDGQFWIDNSQRSMANNSVAYSEKPDSALFMEEWLNLVRSGSGERGIFNVKAAREKADRFDRMEGDVRCNPCAEALLMDRQVCNLSEVVVRFDDTEDTLKRKIEAAVMFGCIQATCTNFTNVSPKWKENAENERLIGVSLTGVCDSSLFKKVNDKTANLLKSLKKHAHECSEKFAMELGIVSPKQVTLVKPSGTISQLCNCSSGLHPRYSDYYIRRVRVTSKDPIAYLLLSKNIPCNPEVGQTWDDYNTLVFEFPMKSPRGSVQRTDFTALEQLEYWKMFNDHWCDGNPSVTIYVKEDEWVEVGGWVYKNWDHVCGLSFLPFDGGNYELAPYQAVTKDEYHNLCKLFSNIEIDFDAELNQFEQDDNTTGSREVACSGGSCDLI